MTSRSTGTTATGWPAGVVVAAVLVLGVGPVAGLAFGGAAAAAAIEWGLTVALVPLVVLVARRVFEGPLRPGRDFSLVGAVVAVAVALHLAAGGALAVLVAGAGWSAEAFGAAVRVAFVAQAGVLVAVFSAAILCDRLLGAGRLLREGGDSLRAAERRASSLAVRGNDVARQLKDESEKRGQFERIHQHSRLEALRARLMPSFLVGVVDGARAVAKDDPSRAEQMLVRLSLLLRTALREGGADLVPLAEEIERTDAVLDLERDRLGKRLKYLVDVPEELLDDLVPALLLPPLVLRAVAAGPGSSKRGGTVEVRATREGDRLQLEIQDDVSEIVRADEARRDPELAALGERLRILYGRGASVKSGARVEGGTRLVIEVPRVAGVEREAS